MVPMPAPSERGLTMIGVISKKVSFECSSLSKWKCGSSRRNQEGRQTRSQARKLALIPVPRSTVLLPGNPRQEFGDCRLIDPQRATESGSAIQHILASAFGNGQHLVNQFLFHAEINQSGLQVLGHGVEVGVIQTR